WRAKNNLKSLGKDRGFGELRMGKADKQTPLLAGIEPLHGNILTVYVPRNGTGNLHQAERIVLDEDLREGHGLAVADFSGQGQDQVVAGWRSPNKAGLIGIKLYIPFNSLWEAWSVRAIDIGDMACEDLAVADLNGDGKP